jgi:hypothetical protein
MAHSQTTATVQAKLAVLLAGLMAVSDWLDAKLGTILAAGHLAADALRDGSLTSADDLDAIAERAAAMDQNSSGVVDAVGGAILSIAIVALLLNEVLGMDAFNLENGPMSGLNIGETAVSVFGILLLGVLVMAFVWIRQIWGGF